MNDTRYIHIREVDVLPITEKMDSEQLKEFLGDAPVTLLKLEVGGTLVRSPQGAVDYVKPYEFMHEFAILPPPVPLNVAHLSAQGMVVEVIEQGVEPDEPVVVLLYKPVETRADRPFTVVR